jgi:hypothetical protein
MTKSKYQNFFGVPGFTYKRSPALLLLRQTSAITGGRLKNLPLFNVALSCRMDADVNGFTFRVESLIESESRKFSRSISGKPRAL